MSLESGPIRLDRGPFEPAAVREELDRILHSPSFANAPSLTRFLRYLVEATLKDGGGQLKEYSLGVEVFDRGEAFDPRIDTIVRAQARRLRAKLEQYYREDGRLDPIVIEVPKGGYAASFQSASATSGALTTRPRETGMPPQRSRRLIWLTLSILAAAAVLALGWPRPEAARSPEIEAVRPPQPESVAVLPLENLAGDPGDDYLADGVSDHLTKELGRIEALRVISRQAARRYKGSGKALATVAGELNVDALVHGSFSRSGERVQIVATLVRPGAQGRAWSQTFYCELGEIASLQREVALSVATELLGRAPSLDPAPPVSPEAYDLYLRGLYHARLENRDDNAEAIAMFEKAVSIDPSFAAAYAELASASARRFFLFTPEEKQWEVNAFVAVKKALALDPNLAAAYAARGTLLWTPAHRFPHDRAIREYQLALEMDPNLDEARQMLSLVFTHVGLLDEALEEVEKELAINPGSWAGLRTGQALLYQGKAAEALRVLRGIPVEVNPAIVGFHSGLALFQLGRIEEAAAEGERILASYPDDSSGILAALQAMTSAASGDAAAAEAKIRIAIEKGAGFGHFHHTAYGIGSAYALMHRPRESVHWLETAAQVGFPCYPLFANDRTLDPIRGDREFEQLLSRLKGEWERRKATLRN
jgi:TolB-like protein